MAPSSLALFSLLLLAPLALGSAPSLSEMRRFHPMHKHVGSQLEPPSPALHSASDLYTADSPLSYEIKTIRKTILRRRSRSGSAGFVVQDDSWSNLGGGQEVVPDEDDALAGWDEVEVDAPDLTDKQTLVNLARIANDAYASPGESRWMELDKYNLVSLTPFGLLHPYLCSVIATDTSPPDIPDSALRMGRG
jgi:hypothetical protein